MRSTLRVVEEGQKTELVERALEGDRPALKQLLHCIGPIIERQAAKVLLASRARRERGVREDVEDLAQEVLVHLFAKRGAALRTWDPARGKLEPFVAAVARNQTYSLLRSRSRSPFSEDATTSDKLEKAGGTASEDPEQLSAARKKLGQLELALRQRLSPQGFEIFRKLFVSQQSVEEVCQETGLSVEAIYKWRSRMRQTAREVEQQLSRIVDSRVSS